jgi:hypothetical protein
MQIRSSNFFPFGGPQDDHGDDQGLSGIYIFMCLIGVALALIGGYLLVMKLIDESRLEDCLLVGRKNCMPIELPLKR